MMYETKRAFLWRTRSHQIMYALLALGLVTAWVWLLPFLHDIKVPDVGFWTWLEPVTGIATLAAALGVWFGELNQDYENSLPKVLNVFFRYQNRDLFVCKNAYLTSEIDIRPLAQQIGGQMAGAQLRFDPLLIRQLPPEIVQQGSKIFRSYTIVFSLMALPEPVKAGDRVINQEVLDKMHANCLFWTWDEEQGKVSQVWEPLTSQHNP